MHRLSAFSCIVGPPGAGKTRPAAALAWLIVARREEDVAVVASIRKESKTTVFWPDFNRVLDEATPEAIAITLMARLVITEANRLLVHQPRWREAVRL